MNYYFVFSAVVCLLVSVGSIVQEKPMAISRSLLIALLGASFVSLFVLPDYHTYQTMFDVTPSLIAVAFHGAVFSHVYGEPGYTLLMSAFKIISTDFYYFRFLVVFLALYLKLYFIFKVAKPPVIAVVAYFALFFYMDSFLLRQSLAAGIMALALLSLIEGKALRYVALVCVAATFHVSALAALPLIFARTIDLNRFQALIILLAILVLGFSGVGKYLAVLVDQGWLPHYLNSKILRYSVSERGDATGLLRGAVLLYTTGVLLYIIFQDQLRRNFLHYSIVLCVALYGLLFLIGFNDFGIFGDRVFRLFGVIFSVVFAVLCIALVYAQRAYWVLPISFLFVLLSMFLVPTGRVMWL